jgi:predicted NUDIX family NTP pyrophosphohydrolase
LHSILHERAKGITYISSTRAEGGSPRPDKHMARRSAGILAYRWEGLRLEVLLGHPGGPFWSRRDQGAWSILKGEYEESEDPETAARREFTEESGWILATPLEPLGAIRQRGGKIVTAYAAQADFDPATLRSNVFEMEWPPGSKRTQFDRAGWFTLTEAGMKIVPGQAGFLDRLLAGLALTRNRGR